MFWCQCQAGGSISLLLVAANTERFQAVVFAAHGGQEERAESSGSCISCASQPTEGSNECREHLLQSLSEGPEQAMRLCPIVHLISERVYSAESECRRGNKQGETYRLLGEFLACCNANGGKSLAGTILRRSCSRHRRSRQQAVYTNR